MSATILIAEDHNFLRRALRGWLEIKFPGCIVLEAVSGEEAIVLTQASSPHLVIVNGGLFGVNGLKVAERIKAAVPATLVVVLTDYEGEIYGAGTPANGVDAYVSKGMMLSELQPTLQALLSSQSDLVRPG